MANNVTLSVKGLTKVYGTVTVLDNVSIDFYKGEIHALLGENGAGKSTLCKSISGAITPERGRIELDGKNFTGITPIKARAAGIGMVYQEFNLVPELPIYENLFIGAEIRHGIFVDSREMIKRGEEIFQKMGIDIDVHQKIKDISVAYCQLVEIAKALLLKSKILILDEPTAPLTDTEVEILFDVLDNLKKEGITMIYISHRLEEIFRLCDRLTVLRDGQFIKTLNTSETNKDELIHLMIGRELSQEFPPRPDVKISDEVVLAVEHLTNSRIKDVSFELHQGEILGLAGLVGAGRTETVRAIFGADKIDSGQIFVNGKAKHFGHPIHAIKSGIGLIPEDRKREGLMLLLPIFLNMTVIIIEQLSKLLLVSRKEEKKVNNELAELVSIKAASLDQNAGELSGGNQQKIVLAKWIAQNPNILFFDEPTRGIDVGAKKDIYDFLFKLKSEGKSMIVISSEMPEVLNLCDRIIVMHEGVVTGELPWREATQEKVLKLASGLT